MGFIIQDSLFIIRYSNPPTPLFPIPKPPNSPNPQIPQFPSPYRIKYIFPQPLLK